MDSTGAGAASDILLDSIVKAKRETVLVACQTCRKRKQKCDGHRPCQRCVAAQQPCQFESAENETPRQTQKRRFESMSVEVEAYREMRRHMMKMDEPGALDICKRIRRNHSPGTIVADLADFSSPNAHQESSPAQQELYFSLVQSTGSLDEIFHFAGQALAPDVDFHFPSGDAHRRLREGLLTPRSLACFFPSTDTSYFPVQIPESLYAASLSYNGPIVRLHAAPWTNGRVSDEAVSHLVSIFLSFLNPYWRMVEDDLFLRDMQSREETAIFCSSLLLNAILAYAAMFSEHKEAFTLSRELTDRGTHFYHEAKRMWESEKSNARIATVQASIILALVASLRGQDRVSKGFVATAVDLNTQIKAGRARINVPEADRENFSRVTKRLTYAVDHLDVAFSTAFLQNCEGTIAESDDIGLASESINPIVYWIPYPIERNAVQFRPNLLQYHRIGLTRLSYELNALLASEGERGDAEHFWRSSKDLFRRLQHWYYSLPADLRYMNEMPTTVLPACVFELHCQYYCLQMQLSDLTYKVLGRAGGRDPLRKVVDIRPDVRAELKKNGLFYARQAAVAARDYRETFGLKIILPFVFQSTAHASFIFLRHMQGYAVGSKPDDVNESSEDYVISFTECFRLLLASAFQTLIGQGVTQMIVKTARALKVALPRIVEHALSNVDGYIWHASDLDTIDSVFPNWAIALEPSADATEYEMGQFLRRWDQGSSEDRHEEQSKRSETA